MDKNLKIPLIVLFGPTGSGKTQTAIRLCKDIGGEVVSADSMQIYKYMDIGTAKPDFKEQDGVKHYMLDVVNPWENYSLSDYVNDASKCIEEIYAKGKIPVLAGGTGLYIDTLINGVTLSEGVTDEKYREYLFDLALQNGNEYVHNMLKEIDAKEASKIHFNNVKRVVRALEIHHTLGITKSEHIEKTTKRNPKYNTLKFCMDIEREVLYQRINDRVDKMLERGLLDEVESILKMGVTENNTSMQAIGYKEPLEYLKGRISYDEMVSLLKQSTRRYAKRQITWFKREENTTLINPYNKDFYNELKKAVKHCIIK